MRRAEWGYGKDEKLSVDEIIHEKYRGIRPAAGYPACPDHTEKGTLWEMLDVEEKTGMQITESFAMWPGSSVSGLYFAHPEARYFSLGKIGRDQVEDYAARKGMRVSEVERWLGQNLNYEPVEALRPRVWGLGSRGPGTRYQGLRDQDQKMSKGTEPREFRSPEELHNSADSMRSLLRLRH